MSRSIKVWSYNAKAKIVTITHAYFFQWKHCKILQTFASFWNIYYLFYFNAGTALLDVQIT